VEGAGAKEVGETMTQYHIVNNWLWLGAVDDLSDAATLLRTPPGSIRMAIKSSASPS
jgi:excinuclease Cho